MTQAPLSECTPIQAMNFTPKGRAKTELARCVAAKKDWLVSMDDQICDETGLVVTDSIEDAAERMLELQWIIPAGVLWANIPHEGVDAASALREASQLSRS